jgi:hypothetical protein
LPIPIGSTGAPFCGGVLKDQLGVVERRFEPLAAPGVGGYCLASSTISWALVKRYRMFSHQIFEQGGEPLLADCIVLGQLAHLALDQPPRHRSREAGVSDSCRRYNAIAMSSVMSICEAGFGLVSVLSAASTTSSASCDR